MSPHSATPKNSQACDTCKSLKVRCQPSSTPGICQKCLKSGRSLCNFTDRQPRPARYRKVDTRARIAELERQLKDANATSASNDDVPVARPVFDVASSIDVYQGLSNVPLNVLMSNSSDIVATTLSSCGVSLRAAELYLARFRTMSRYFPFVVLPLGASCLEIASKSPFLSMSVICVASSSTPKTQKQLEYILRKSLLQRLTIDGDRTLDLLQALLIYLAWYHFFSTPKRDQTYLMTQLAIGVCSDLGLDQSPSEAVSRPFGLRLEHYRADLHGNGVHDEFFSTDARRTYLGCCYIAVQNSMVFGKLTTVGINKHMLACADSLTNEPDWETDTWIGPLIRLQQISNEYHTLLLTACNNCEDLSGLAIIRAHVDALKQKLLALQNDAPSTAKDSVVLKVATQFAQIYAQELDIINPVARKHKSCHKPTELDNSPASVRLEILLLCFRSTLAIIQMFLSFPIQEYSLLSNLQWSSFIASAVFMYRFCVGLPNVPEWDTQIARNAIELDDFLQTISERLHDVTRHVDMSKPHDPPNTLFMMLGPIFEDVRRTWNHVKDKSIGECQNPHIKAHTMEPSNDSTTTTSLNSIRSPPYSTSTMPGQRCPARDFWIHQTHSLVVMDSVGPESQQQSTTGQSAEEEDPVFASTASFWAGDGGDGEWPGQLPDLSLDLDGFPWTEDLYTQELHQL